MNIVATAFPPHANGVVPEKMGFLWALHTRHGACITHMGLLSGTATYQLGVLSAMKIITLVFLLLLATQAVAQQNLFNIPSGDVNERNTFFYQHQINFHRSNFELKAHFVYGLGEGWDIGLNLVGKNFYFNPNWRMSYNDNPNQGALYPFLMPTIQKQFKLSEQFNLNIGSQIGTNLSTVFSNKELGFFNYGLGVFHFMDNKSRIVGGIYYASSTFVGIGNHVGILFGYEIKISERFYLMGDWLSGTNDSSVGVFGVMYNVSKRVQLCVGALIPNPGTPKPFGAVLEINIMSWDLKID
jgi:hypothetical protein